MNQGMEYLKDAEHAAKSLFDVITAEEKERALLSNEISQNRYRKWVADNRVSPHVHKLPPGEQMALWAQTMRNLNAEGEGLREKQAELHMRMSARQFSIGVLAGSVLQIAKQAISLRGGWRQCKHARL